MQDNQNMVSKNGLRWRILPSPLRQSMRGVKKMQKGQSALLVMDFQNGIVERYADKPEVIVPFQRAVNAARYAEIPVIFVRVAFRDGYP